MARRHLICRHRLYLSPTQFSEFESGFWTLSEASAAALIGGTLYLHEAKAMPAYFAGDVIGYRIAGPHEPPDKPRPGKIVFILRSREPERRVWEGQDHRRSWDSGHIE
jgi:hypothetical protein